MRASLFCSVALCALCLAGCPRELQPPPPGMASICDDHPDCNGGRTCGPLALCVGGYCEQEPSIAVPCPEEGVPIPAPEETD
ncbi:MAG: hypothetical protein M3Y87_14650 [Myxococcota bacterium]|nr:hypothetical protein [Myxococcota bacterium]